MKRLMGEHKNSKPNPIAKRLSRNRKSNESILDYMAKLRRLNQFYDYGTVLNDMLRDKLVCDLNHNEIQQKLLRVIDRH